MVGILIAVGFVAVVALAMWLPNRKDLRRLHKKRQALSDSPGEAGGMTAAGMTGIGGNFTHM